MARGLTYVSRKKELTNQLALQVRFISAMQKSMRKQIRLSMQEATTKFEKSGSNADIGAVIDKGKPELYVILVAQYRAIMKTFGKRILDVAKFTGPTEIKANEDLFEQSIQQYINLWATDKVTLISDTTKEQMSRLIANGLSEELSGAEIAKSIRTQIPVISAIRAETIARTEVHAAASYANQSAAEATNIEMDKEWIAFIDGREREAHRQADGQTVPMNEDFTVDGESLAYPGDPSGSAGNVINCRCVVGYIPRGD